VPVNTLKAYGSDLRCFARSVPPDLSVVDVAAIRTFLSSGEVAASTRRRRHAALRSFYRWLVREELVDINPMEQPAPPQLPRRRSVIVLAERISRRMESGTIRGRQAVLT
jgi:site-specific recombinase XerD